MQNLRVLRQRIRSVQNTQKITRAMQMVAGAKLRRMQEELLALRPYADSLEKITQRFLSGHPGLEHPLLEAAPVMVSLSNHDRTQARSPFDKLSANGEAPPGLVVVTSDTGLCGTYNEKVLGLAERFLAERPSALTVAIGKKGVRLLARRLPLAEAAPGASAHRGIRRTKEIVSWGGRYDAKRAEELLGWLERQYLEGSVSGWSVAYTRFLSALSWKPAVEPLLPLTHPSPPRGEGKGEGDLPEKVIVEPDVPRFLEQLLRQHVRARMSRVLLEAFTAEHSARMVAMKNATENAVEMIDTLTLVRNKARQAAITKELIEVVSGAEALK